ncbi:MAG: hypothetical protein ABSC06_08210 [Rhodopila sp.]|jgi:hypothetical protein
MNMTGLSGYKRIASTWIVLLVTSGMCLSIFFACVTPFAALATLAALNLSRREALAVVGLAWLANQIIGYAFLSYPWNWGSVAWGLAIGLSSSMAVLAARGLSTSRPAPLAVSLPFMAAFAAFESGLYVAGLVLSASEGAFSASVVGHVFLVNAASLCGLLAVYQLVMMSGLIGRRDELDLPKLGSALYR